MPTKFDEAFTRVEKLVATFHANKERYLSADYQEAEVRKDFIDKFFIALGWDVNHDEQTNPYAQEVKVERGVNEGSARKRADYAFMLAPNFRDVRFYVEAKRPSNDFASADNYLQAIRYGWFTKRTSPFAVLTSFDDFHILDCRLKPDINDTLSRVVERFSYTDFADREKFARIYWLFSREAVAGGSLEELAESRPASKGKRFQRGLFKGGDTNPDDDFLEELDGYRQKLAQAFKKRNPDLDGDLLTEVTQRTLDRLVFTRFLEDKGIETPQVENFGKSEGVWEDFVNASLRLDRKYNGVVYKWHPKLDVPGFAPDGNVFARICEELSDPTSPYNFNSIPIHILGSIYERFLGKVISDSARVVEKPEVRKAGGVYYTPEYIVRYIVENTVGKMIEGKTPAQIAEMKFADIACGSGSFLLGVYDVLLQYHAKYYTDHPGKVKKGDCVRRDGSLHLSLQKKRDILTNNLFGVDIDRQAVEVAQLSLYLKLLEDETVGTTSEFQTEFHFTLLPSLDKNIVCGNSLIGPDILDGGKLSVDEEKKLNPMDYAQRFPQIFRRKVSSGELREAAPLDYTVPGVPLHGSYGKISYKKKKNAKPAPHTASEMEYEGGFDVVVGNPPYGADVGDEAVTHLRKKFECAGREVDSYAIFMEQGFRLLRSGGLLSMIVPTGWYSGARYPGLRRFVARNTDPTVFVNLPYDIFADAWVDTTIFVAAKRKAPTTWPRTESCRVTLRTFGKRDKIESIREFETDQTFADFAGWFADGGDTYLTYADEASTRIIKKLESAGVPLSAYADIQRGVTPFHLTDKPTHKTSQPAFEGTVRRYSFERGPTRFVRFDDTLMEFKPEKYFHGPRLLVRELISRQFQLQAVRADESFVTNKSMQSVLPLAGGPNLNFLLGCFNSRLLSWFFLQKSNIAQRDDFPKIVLKETRSLPFPKIDLKIPTDKARHDKLMVLVDQMLAAKKALPQAQSERDKEFYENKCATLDHQIDALVYDLYGLTDAEIKLVEGAEK